MKPEVRFKGFEDDWSNSFMKDVASFSKGKGYSKDDLISKGDPIILYGQMYTNYRFVIDTVKTYAKHKPKSVISTGNEVIIPSSGETSEEISRAAAVLKPGVILGGDLNIIKPNNDISASYLAMALSTNTAKKQMSNRAQGKSVVHLYSEDIKEVQVFFPSIDEQKRISNLIKELDNSIELKNKELSKLKQFKQAMLQEMFPQEGERYPRLRFAGFTDAWEQRKLGEIAQITMGQSPNSQNYTDNPNDHILVQGNADMKNGRVLPRVWTTQVTKQAEKNDLILSVRAPVGDVGKTDYDVVLGRGVAGIKGNEFIFQLLTRMKENGYWRNLSTGSTFESINSNDIKEAYVLIPNNGEQTKIGEFFKELDNLITLHQRELEKLKQLKQAMLQKMFV